MSTQVEPSDVRARVGQFIKDHPHLTYVKIAERLGCSHWAVSAVAREHGVHRRPRRITAAAVAALQADHQTTEVSDVDSK